MSVQIVFEEMPVSDPYKDFAGRELPGRTRVIIHWKRFEEVGESADTVRVGVIVDYDLSQSVLDKRRQARGRLAEILQQAAADLEAWVDPNDPTA